MRLRLSTHPATAALLLSLWFLTTASQALQSGKTGDGAAYVTGGVSHEELSALHARRNEYTLWVITAASKSGSYLADVLVEAFRGSCASSRRPGGTRYR
jgi:hypothetical protein